MQHRLGKKDKHVVLVLNAEFLLGCTKNWYVCIITVAEYGSCSLCVGIKNVDSAVY